MSSIVAILAAVTAVRPVEASTQWHHVAPMTFGRYFHEGALLHDGRVIIVGGAQGVSRLLPNASFPTAEIYDPATDQWALTAPTQTFHAKHTVTVLQDGRVLVTGGEGRVSAVATIGGNELTNSEVYDPTSDRWTLTEPMIVVPHNHSATLLPDGRVLVAGGQADAPPGNQVATTQIYDPATNTWAETGPMHHSRGYHAAALLPGGRVLVAGGINPDDDSWPPLSSAEIWDPATGEWNEVSSMHVGRHSESDFAAELLDGRVLVVGGAADADGDGTLAGPTETASAEIFDPGIGSWSLVAEMSHVRADHTVTPLPDGRVLVLGGGFNPGGLLFVGPIPVGIAPVLATGEIFDPATGSWSAIPPMSDRRANHATVAMADGTVLTAGGHGTAPVPWLIHTSAERLVDE